MIRALRKHYCNVNGKKCVLQRKYPKPLILPSLHFRWVVYPKTPAFCLVMLFCAALWWLFREMTSCLNHLVPTVLPLYHLSKYLLFPHPKMSNLWVDKIKKHPLRNIFLNMVPPPPVGLNISYVYMNCLLRLQKLSVQNHF